MPRANDEGGESDYNLTDTEYEEDQSTVAHTVLSEYASTTLGSLGTATRDGVTVGGGGGTDNNDNRNSAAPVADWTKRREEAEAAAKRRGGKRGGSGKGKAKIGKILTSPFSSKGGAGNGNGDDDHDHDDGGGVGSPGTVSPGTVGSGYQPSASGSGGSAASPGGNSASTGGGGGGGLMRGLFGRSGRSNSAGSVGSNGGGGGGGGDGGGRKNDLLDPVEQTRGGDTTGGKRRSSGSGGGLGPYTTAVLAAAAASDAASRAGLSSSPGRGPTNNDSMPPTSPGRKKGPGSLLRAASAKATGAVRSPSRTSSSTKPPRSPARSSFSRKRDMIQQTRSDSTHGSPDTSYISRSSSRDSYGNKGEGHGGWDRSGLPISPSLNDDGGGNDRTKKNRRGGAGGGGGDGEGGVVNVRRYRGFSTSVSSLFLDESIVCGAVSCFGLLLSHRTEHLLNVRNSVRGLSRRGGTGKTGKDGDKRKPSLVLGVALIVTLVGMAATYAYWGFGKGIATVDYDFDEGNYDLDRYNNNNNNNNNGGDGANYNNNDDGANYQYGDDAVNNNNNWNYQYGDDAVNNNNGNNNYQYGDDAANNNYNYNNGNGDDGQGDDGQYQDDGDDGQGDDGANQNDDGGNNNNRRAEETAGMTRLPTSLSSDQYYCGGFYGLCKIKDYHDGLWTPLYGLLNDVFATTNNGDEPPDRYRKRQMEDGNGNNGGNAYYDQSAYDQYDTDDDGTDQPMDAGGWIRTGLAIAFLILLGIVGRRRRMRTRYEILRARAQDDHLFQTLSSETGSSSGELNFQNGGVRLEGLDDPHEDKYEGACSHTLCGCYPVDSNPQRDDDDDETAYAGDDRTVDETVLSEETGAAAADRRGPKRKRKNEDCMSRAFSCLSACCCGLICKVWIQCFSICALAQEGREVRLLLPPRLQRIDFLTHQPFHEYYSEIYNLRLRWLAKNRDRSRNVRGMGIRPHFRALSLLSRYILIGFALATIAVILTMVFNPLANFGWGDTSVLLATFGQSFLVLFVVHWIFHKSDLSFDAVVKFFAAGFAIATPTAFLTEGILINLALFGVYLVYAICAVIWDERFLDWVVANYRLFWIIGELINAYIVAAVTEELCKYYTFRFVEHPDLIFLTGLDRSAQDESALYGGVKNYAFNAHNVSLQASRSLSRTHTAASMDTHDSDYNVASGHNRSRGGGHRGKRSKDVSIDAMSTSLNGDYMEELTGHQEEVRTLRQRAAAITTAMISTAVGLACAENFIYVFFFGGANTGAQDEMAVLIFRSIFPVHALAAAMQSVGVIRKFLEGSDGAVRYGVGKIILPAIILHGTFDAILMGINVFIESSWDKYLKDNNGNIEEGYVPYNAFVVDVVAWVGICLTMLVGLLWYYIQNRNQKLRLKMLEEKEQRFDDVASMAASLAIREGAGYVNPKVRRGDNDEGSGLV